MIEREGNYIDGTRMQMDYDELMKMVQVAYLDKKSQLQELVANSWPTDKYGKESLYEFRVNWYHQDTRGQQVALLGKEFERIANVLHHLQALGESKDRQANFSWWFNDEGEEE
jgi:hypothetical protein|tara:strand:- start:198 stop:536 length:339 start_codon:yes stop_codon:yes gene_type:complete